MNNSHNGFDEPRNATADSGGIESAHPAPAPSGDGRWATPGVRAVAAASFFSDSGHEVTTSVLFAFLTGTLGSSAAVLGVIDGISDAVIGLMKLLAGPLANDPHRRAATASGGYLGTAIATALIGAAPTVWQVGALRAIAWLSRGLRSPVRDALLASLSPKAVQGRAFGLKRGGDNLGAVAGPLLAAGLVNWVGVRATLYLAAVPGPLAALAIVVAARESRRQLQPRPQSAARRLEFGALRDAGMLRALAPVLLFEFSNLATTLLILRTTQLLASPHRSVAAATSIAVLIYAGHNAIASTASLAVGRWYDRAGPRAVFASGAAVYVIAYIGFAVGSHSLTVVALTFAAAGARVGLAEPTESAVVAQLLPDGLRGSGFGVLGIIQAAGDVAATIIAGLLYTFASPAAAFGYAAVWMVAAAFTSAMLGRGVDGSAAKAGA